MARLLISTGEVSGDLQGGLLIQASMPKPPGADCRWRSWP